MAAGQRAVDAGVDVHKYAGFTVSDGQVADPVSYTHLRAHET
ncbi:tannase [Lactobacillus paraplantarum] [Lactiplantibacillus mudanjiangensis]|nr:tannase [Lactobacillus paraplantarum] [Lactiplantibacillus mudanjiangensis]